MEYSVFKELLVKGLKDINQDIEKSQIEKLYNYMNLLIEKNKDINLTAIIKPEEIIEKHLIDSLSIAKEIPEKSKIIDIGTGAGFPGNILSIYLEKKEIEMVLVDSVNKKLEVLNQFIKELEIKNTKTLHGRAEDIGQDKDYREKFDIAVSRAVASLDVLIEYLIPLVKVNGKIICMKGPIGEEELKAARKGIELLGGDVEEIKKIKIGDSERKIIIIKKIKNTPKKYPRKPGIPSKSPIK